MAYLANAKRYKKNFKMTEIVHMGTHLRGISKSYPMDTNMTGWVLLMLYKNLCILVLWTTVASALEGISESSFKGCTTIHCLQSLLCYELPRCCDVQKTENKNRFTHVCNFKIKKK